MLETMRRNSRSAIIYVMFGILIAVFVLSFGPGNRGFVSSSAASNVAAKVAGATISEQDFRFAFSAIGWSQVPPQVARDRKLKEFVMDKLIERELLADEASRLGFQVSQKEAEDMVIDGRMMVMGLPRRINTEVFTDGNFNYEKFKLVCQRQLGVSVLRFIEIQRRELLAEKMREAMRTGVRVSPGEVKSEFEERGLQANLEFVKLSARKFEVDEEPAAADVAAYAKAHEAELKKLYEDRKPLLFTKIEKQAKLRHVLVELGKDATAETTTKAQARIDEAKKKIDGGAAIADVAAQLSTNELQRRRRGAMGWKKKGFTGFGEALDAKVFAADVKKGALIGPERTDRGFELVQVEDLREGDISYEQAAAELAEQELLRSRAKDKAKAEAQAVIDRVKKGEKLEAIFPPPKDEHGADDKSPEAKIARLMGSGPQGDAPALRETGLISRRGDMVQDIGVSKELSKKAFELPVGEVAGPFEVTGSYVIVRVKDHKDPDMKDFEKRRLDLEKEAARAKWISTVETWSKQACIAARDGGHIRVNEELMSYEGMPAAPKLPVKVDGKSDGKIDAAAEKLAYQPCTAHMPF